MTQVDTLVVTDPAKLKLLADPTKQRLLAEFAVPNTVQAVAKRLNMSGKGIYRHVEQLVTAEFLFVVSTRKTRGTVERTLQTTAKQFSGQVGDSNPSGPWSDFLRELVRSSSNGDGQRMLAKTNLKLSPDDWPKLVDEFTELLGKYESETADSVSIYFVVTPELKP